MNSQTTAATSEAIWWLVRANVGPGDQLDGEGQGGRAQGEQTPGGADVGGEGHQPADRAGVVALAALDGLGASTGRRSCRCPR